MKALVVVENPDRWPLDIPGVEVVSARSYLTDARFSEYRRATVFNLCRAYGYQTIGYYVSLLALARGHRPLPSVATLQDLRIPHLIRLASDELEQLIQRSLSHLRGETFELSIYFGKNMAKRYDRLCLALFNQFPAPMLRARFVRSLDEAWELERLRLVATSEIPETHRDFVVTCAREYLERRPRSRSRHVFRYDMAILCNPEEKEPPSDPRAIRKFIAAARELDIDASVIEPDDYASIAEFDALFLRETTFVNHHTYRFSRRAAAEGLVVIDDPDSIVRCSNKVFLAEAFARNAIDCPRTVIAGAGDAEMIERKVGLPCVLKQPDSAFSQGVVRASTSQELRDKLAKVLESSQLAIAQEYAPSDFDWRVGILGGAPLYACKYHMARGHWQIVATGNQGKRRYGKVENLPLHAVPRNVIDLAVRAARIIGDGLYGVDLKQAGDRALVIEVNDNPTIEAGYEDDLMGDELYLEIMRWFRKRLDARGNSGPRS